MDKEELEIIASDLAPTYEDVGWDACYEKIKEGIRTGIEKERERIQCIIRDYIQKGAKCMEQSNEQGEQGTYTFWDGFHNCAENLLRDLED